MIRIGTAGWHYKDWSGIVYPQPRPRGFDPLEMLAGFFDTIEINVTFYRVPDPSMSRRWVQRVGSNPAFRFTAKLPRVFTHAMVAAGRSGSSRGPGTGSASARPGRKGIGRREPDSSETDHGALTQDPDEEERRFRETLAPLLEANRLGAVLIQFPQSFHAGPEEASYLGEILDRFSNLPLVAEFRHAGWGREESVEELKRRGVGFCNIDQPRMGATLRPTAHVTGPIAYVRLHGRNYAEWFRVRDRDHRPEPEEYSGAAGDRDHRIEPEGYGAAGYEEPAARPRYGSDRGRGAGSERRYDYLYSEKELAPWISTIRSLAEEGADTYVITNNHFRGKAAVNALQIKAALEGGLVDVPDTLVAAYPALSSIAKPPAGRLPF